MSRPGRPAHQRTALPGSSAVRTRWPPARERCTLASRSSTSARTCAASAGAAPGASQSRSSDDSFTTAASANSRSSRARSDALRRRRVVERAEGSRVVVDGEMHRLTDPPKLEKITALAFGQRRKMLRQSLKAAGGEKLLDRAGIDARRRAETLSVAEFVTLANLAEGLSTGS